MLYVHRPKYLRFILKMWIIQKKNHLKSLLTFFSLFPASCLHLSPPGRWFHSLRKDGVIRRSGPTRFSLLLVLDIFRSHSLYLFRSGLKCTMNICSWVVIVPGSFTATSKGFTFGSYFHNLSILVVNCHKCKSNNILFFPQCVCSFIWLFLSFRHI